MNAAGIILAAGVSRRLGSAKQLALVGGQRLLDRTLRLCKSAGLDPIIVVLGAHAARIQEECELDSATVVMNDDWKSGQASSIRRGVAMLSSSEIEAALLVTCDMPFIAPGHLRELVILAHKTQRNSASEGGGWRGVPACFLRNSFHELIALDGDAGARSLLRDSPTVLLENCLDVDTPEDLKLANEIAAQLETA